MATSQNPAKIHGFANGNDQFLAAGMEMFTITSPAGAVLTNPYVLDAVIQTISTVCAPVLLGTPTATSLAFAVDRKGLPIAGTGAGNFTTVQDKLQALGTASVGTAFYTAADEAANSAHVAGTASAFADFTTGTPISIAAGFAYGE